MPAGTGSPTAQPASDRLPGVQGGGFPSHHASGTAAYVSRNRRMTAFSEVPCWKARKRDHMTRSGSMRRVRLTSGRLRPNPRMLADDGSSPAYVPLTPMIARVSSKPFASSADLAAKEATLEELATGRVRLHRAGRPERRLRDRDRCDPGHRGARHAGHGAALDRRGADAQPAALRRPGADPLPRRAGAGRQRLRRAPDHRHAA